MTLILSMELPPPKSTGTALAIASKDFRDGIANPFCANSTSHRSSPYFSMSANFLTVDARGAPLLERQKDERAIRSRSRSRQVEKWRHAPCQINCAPLKAS